MSDEQPTPIDEVIGEGADAGPGAEPETTSAPTDERGDKSWTYSALKDERSKRQALAERNAELEAQLQSHTQQQQPPGPDDIWTDPEGYIARQVHAASMPTTMRASRAEYVADHGRASYKAVEDAVGAAMQSGHPDMPLLAEAMRRSDDPVAVAASWVETTRQQSRPRAPSYPSNLSGARNVGTRSGPVWSGPTDLNDIFERGRR